MAMSKDTGAPAIDHFADASKKVATSIDATAAKAIAELRAMSIRNRRSLGQRVRWAMVRGGR